MSVRQNGASGGKPLDADWNALPDRLQLALTRAALSRAADTIAGQAEALAKEMEAGRLADRGGPDALRLLAAVVRSQDERAGVAGHG
ncbi:MAG: hypothetical protein KGI51_11130 [Rhodospirillales bacterium]|nr:hypothetical protein [Rhodospirillales bacterium]